MRARDLAPLTLPIAAAVLAGASSAAVRTFGRTVMAAAREGEEAYSVTSWMVLGAVGVLGATAGRITQAWGVRTAWALSTVATAGATVVLGTAPGAAWAAHLSVAVFGAGYTALCGVLILWAARAVPGRASGGAAVLFIALAIGQAAGSAVLGLLVTPTSPALAFVVAGTLGLFAVLPALRDRPRPPSRGAERPGTHRGGRTGERVRHVPGRVDG